MKSFMFAAISIIFLSPVAHAKGALDGTIQKKIEAACIETVQLKNPKLKNPELFCRCIASAHWKAAKEEPDLKDAEKQLKWVLQYYSAHDEKTLKALASKPENLVDFDMMVAEDCSPK